MAVFPFKWSDGTWRDGPEPGSQPEPRKPWTPTGFFKHYKRMSRREVAMKASNARMWLEYTLREPTPASEILRLARQDGINEWSLRRAKRHHKIRSVKRGGRQCGYGAIWFWQPNVSN